MKMIEWSDFEKIDMRVGTIIAASSFPEARKPAYQLIIDFGSMGIKKTSAQITVLYSTESLVGMQVIAVVNFPPKRIAGFTSDCLVLGIYNENNDVVLLKPERPVSNGHKIG
ncbi:tRNA-binding protein [Flavihumibacter sp. ZG627]|uniref:tRNA-binding protein n=1 Tax=Flavihumibacter sp. ZG627 TaxID=1463156 RepID=UPI00352883A6